jgi:hypothetical protein
MIRFITNVLYRALIGYYSILAVFVILEGLMGCYGARTRGSSFKHLSATDVPAAEKACMPVKGLAFGHSGLVGEATEVLWECLTEMGMNIWHRHTIMATVVSETSPQTHGNTMCLYRQTGTYRRDSSSSSVKTFQLLATIT